MSQAGPGLRVFTAQHGENFAPVHHMRLQQPRPVFSLLAPETCS